MLTAYQGKVVMHQQAHKQHVSTLGADSPLFCSVILPCPLLALVLQYDMRSLLCHVLERLDNKLKKSWSLDPSSPSYVLR
jgi:hypothetical protein